MRAARIASRTRGNDLFAWVSPAPFSRPYTNNGLNQTVQAGAVTFAYDGRGNLTSSGSDSYSYTSENRMASGPNGSLFTYDPLGRMTYLIEGPKLTVFQYDGNNLIREQDTAGNTFARHVFGPGSDEVLLSYIANGSGGFDKRYLHSDERGSITAISDASGMVTQINAYDDYGIPQGKSAAGVPITGGAATTMFGRFGYTGQAWLPEIGLYYYKARFYSPLLGRFMQTDPIGYGDGPNLYAYVGGDPINATDPSGLACRDVGKVSNPYCDPANPDDDAPLTTVTAPRFANIGFPDPFRNFQFGGGGYAWQDELDRVRERQPGENPNRRPQPMRKFDLLNCAGKVALGALGGALSPASVIQEVGGAIAGAATRTAPEDATFSSKSGARLQRDARSAIRIGLKRALSAAVSSPQARIASGAFGAGLVLFSSESCGIQAIPIPAEIRPKGF